MKRWWFGARASQRLGGGRRPGGKASIAGFGYDWTGFYVGASMVSAEKARFPDSSQQISMSGYLVS
jgi:hypothetical protein